MMMILKMKIIIIIVIIIVKHTTRDGGSTALYNGYTVCTVQCSHCLKLFSLPELIFVATGGRDFFPGVVKCFQKTT